MKRLFYKITILSTLILSIIIFAISLITISQKEKVILNPLEPTILMLIPGFVFFFIVIIYLSKKIALIKKDRAFFFVTLGFIIIFQILMLNFISKIYPITDCFTTLDQSMAMLKKQGGILNNEKEYFARYTNNYFFTIMMYYWFKIINFFKCDKFYLASIILNVISINSTIVLSYTIVRKLFGIGRAQVVLFLMAICPTTYLFLCFPYTNTFSEPFLLGILLCAINFFQSKSNKWQIIYLSYMAILSAIGMYLRPTTLIPTIAIYICTWIFYKKKNLKQVLIDIGKIAFSLLLIFIISASIHSFINIHLKNPNLDKGFPATHWIMMGLKGTGEYLNDDVQYTTSFKTKQEKTQANLSQIKERVEELGPVGLVKLFISKIGKVWSIGTDDYQILQSSDETFSTGYRYIFGDKNAVAIIYTQLFRAITFLFISIGLIFLLSNKERNLIYIFALTLLGMIIFLMLWETNKKYNICFVPITIILMEQGIFHIIQKLNNDHKKQKQIIHIGVFITLSIGFILLSVIAFYDKGYYTDFKKEHFNYSFYRMENDNKYITDISKEQKKVIQTFSTTKKFNEIALHLVKKQSNTVGDNCYIINLLDDEQKVICSKTVTNNDLPKDGWVTLPVMKDIKNDKDKIYSIVLSSIGQGDDFAKVVYTDSIVFDQYKNGKAYINGKPQAYDLSFRVYEKQMESYYSTSLYLVAVISFLLIYGLILIIIFVVILKERGVIKEKPCVNILNK